MDKERREYPRYQLTNDALAILKPHPIKLGQIINISEGGLAFHYISDNKITPGYIELDIFVSTDGKQCDAFPFKTIKDFRVSNYLDMTTPIRQLCIKFTKLTSLQKSHLRQFIREYTYKNCQAE